MKQEIIITTSDKIKLVLLQGKETLTAQRDWITPLGLLLSFVATLCAEFKDAFGMSPDFWGMFFTLLSIGSGVYLIITLNRLYDNRNTADLNAII